MPLPHWVAVANKRVTNRFVEPFARRSAGFAVVHHIGRRSGTAHSTPVNAFELPPDNGVNRVLIALTYGPRADWYQNALTGKSELERSGRRNEVLSVTTVSRDIAWQYLPRIAKAPLRVMRVHVFAILSLGA